MAIHLRGVGGVVCRFPPRTNALVTLRLCHATMKPVLLHYLLLYQLTGSIDRLFCHPGFCLPKVLPRARVGAVTRNGRKDGDERMSLACANIR